MKWLEILEEYLVEIVFILSLAGIGNVFMWYLPTVIETGKLSLEFNIYIILLIFAPLVAMIIKKQRRKK